MAFDPKGVLHEYLQSGREVMVWKLDGLSEYDMRRPLVASGTNLLGLVRHVACSETGYLGSVFGRPFAGPMPWRTDGAPNGDMWVRAHETTASVIEFCSRVWAHSDATIHAFPLDTMAEVPWWPEGGRDISLQQAMVHVITDLYRHAGHADVLREFVDGAIGADPRWPSLPPGDESWWADHRARVEAAARRAGGVA